MKQIPKHAELIKLWADGAVIQWRVPGFEAWNDCHKNLPTWSPQFEYRVKPEPKPNVVRYAQIIKRDDHVEAVANLFTRDAWGKDNLMVVFDGETGVLKDAQVLASSGE